MARQQLRLYLFKHALVGDSAYGTLLRERRRVLHAQIAETLESQFPDIAKNQDRGFGSMPNAEVHHATLVILAMSTAHVMPVADMAARVVSGRPSGEFPSRAA